MESEQALISLAEEMAFPLTAGLLSALGIGLVYSWSFRRSILQIPGVLFAGRFLVRLRAIYFELNYCRSVPVDSRLHQAWTRTLGSVPIHRTQQVGAAPTFVGVACQDADLADAFAQELLCGAVLWRDLRRRDLLFEVTPDRVQVYVGVRCRLSRRLGRLATSRVLPAARARATGGHQINPHQPPRSPSGEARASLARDGKRLLIRGRVDTAEAEALLEHLSSLWQPEVCGHCQVWIHSDGVEVSTENGPPAMRDRLGRVVEDFFRYVVLADLHLGVCGRDTFGPQKAAALIDLLDDIRRRRSTLILNGDFLELLHERVPDIRASYAEVFHHLAQVRRVVYVVGNHDEDILCEPSLACELGQRVEAVRYFWDAHRGLYFEHGHFAIPACHGSPWGRLLSQSAGVLKRCGFTHIEHWCEDALGGKVQDLYPFVEIQNRRVLIERQVAVATALRALYPEAPPCQIFCSHTHEPARTEANPIHFFVNQATGGAYAATGAWTSRRRLRRQGETRVDWLEIDLRNNVRVRRLDLLRRAVPSPVGARVADSSTRRETLPAGR